MQTKTISVVVIPEGEPIFSEKGTTISITDEGAGEFIEIQQFSSEAKIRIDADEWPFIKAAIDDMVSKCRS